MNVIVLSITGSDEPDFSVWESTKAAAKYACTMIVETIDNEWDLCDYGVLDDANKINDFIQAGDYMEAVNFYNDCDSVCNNCYSHTYWIEDRTISKLSDADGSLKIYNLESDDDDDDEDDDSDSCSPAPVVFDSSNGATCRKCHNPNEYATPDKADGTYICRGCNMMAGVFGGN